ncbi:MAG TPA: hypothetical protein VN282_12955 [Pyrinomonadaceae bacterium]|nr:hypothetical protein [Pyrinomonadaceae bacterium]
MERLTFTLFTDTGGILLLDAEGAGALGDDFVELLNVVLDPEGAAEQAAVSDGDWGQVWSEAVEGLRRLGAGGGFTLVLSGEGTFHVRLQAEGLDEEERGRVVASFEERVRVRSGRLAFTDGLEFFGEELPGEGAVFAEVPEGLYSVRIHHLERHPLHTPTVGVYGSAEHPSLIVQLMPAEAGAEPTPEAGPFPRLSTSREGYEEPRLGWNCYAQVTGVEGGRAALELMLTETVYSGHARMDVPEGEVLRAGDYVLVRLVEDAGDHWRAEWQDDPS